MKAGETRTYWVSIGGNEYTVEVTVDQSGFATTEVYDGGGELVDPDDPVRERIVSAVREFEGRKTRGTESAGG